MIENAIDFASFALQNTPEGATGGGPALSPRSVAAIAVGLAALGTGYAQRGIGSAAVGAVAEDDDMLVPGLIFTALPETLIIIAFVTLFLMGQ